MPNTLTEKAIAQPFRVGLMLGALTLPTLWTLSQDVLNVLTRKPLLNSELITQLFAVGFVPGMILGAGVVRAWVAWRAGKVGEARGLLIGHSTFVALPCLLLLLVNLQSAFSQIATSGWNVVLREGAFAFYLNFPLQVALAMFLLGLFLRGEGA